MVKLVPLQPEHVVPFYTWLRDPEAIAYSLSAFQRMTTTAQIDQWFAATLQQANALNLGIYWEETHALIGYAGLSNISATNQSGEYFIFIGERAAWGKGVGTAVTKQILHLGFTSHPLNRIMLTVSEPNTGGLKAYTKAGFVVEGRLRQAACRQGVFHDKIVMSVLKAEWKPQGVPGGEPNRGNP
ncbi:GNAT family N-acetyltransferase [Hymenobacter coccineus]|uniref:GNAT family N-acetyltransferase n=1 Tax=Hymenobacter coccineus TaxID=1908235 RepID=A0A1G1THI9_9BACT|nr:GNAT family protein [Hymenobacter coccineus]OGX90342.1 GNAT family N-acetyltransferase [Hymenobacter coccineus]